MIRRWHNFTVIVSGALCGIVLCIWRLNAPGFDHRWIISTNDFYVLQLRYGIIELDHTVCSSRNLPADMCQNYWVWTMPQAFNAEWNPRCKSVMGFGIRNEPLVFPMGNVLVVATTHGQSVPMWLLTGIAAILPVRRALRWYRLYRMGPNACGCCGYNLTGNTSGVCPECGTSVASKPEAVA